MIVQSKHNPEVEVMEIIQEELVPMIGKGGSKVEYHNIKEKTKKEDQQ